MSQRTYVLLMSIVFAIAFFLRIVATATFVGLNAPPKASAQPDQVDYESLAYRLSFGKGYTLSDGHATACRTPGTSLLLVPVYLVFGHSYAAGRIWFCLLSALTCIGAGLCGLMVADKRVSLMSAAWLALYPGHLYYAMHFLSETPFGLCLILAMTCTLASFRCHSRLFSIVAGSLWGFAILIRPQMVLLIGLPWPLLMMRKSLRSKYGALAAIQCAIAALMVSGWIVRNGVELGKYSLGTVGGATFWGAHNEKLIQDSTGRTHWLPTSQLVDQDHPLVGTEVEKEAQAWKYGVACFRAHPLENLKLCCCNVLWLFSAYEETDNRLAATAFSLGWFILAPFFAYGVFRMMSRRREIAVILLLPLATTGIGAFVYCGHARIRDGLAPILVIFASTAVCALIEIFAARRRRTGLTVNCSFPPAMPNCTNGA